MEPRRGSSPPACCHATRAQRRHSWPDERLPPAAVPHARPSLPGLALPRSVKVKKGGGGDGGGRVRCTQAGWNPLLGMAGAAWPGLCQGLRRRRGPGRTVTLQAVAAAWAGMPAALHARPPPSVRTPPQPSPPAALLLPTPHPRSTGHAAQDKCYEAAEAHMESLANPARCKVGAGRCRAARSRRGERGTVGAAL